jgi:hypothetical protein
MKSILQMVKDRIWKKPMVPLVFKDYDIQFIEEPKPSDNEVRATFNLPKGWNDKYIGQYNNTMEEDIKNDLSMSINMAYNINNLYITPLHPKPEPPALDLLSKEVVNGLEAGRPKF